MKETGEIHIYTGEGKGKTTAALGLCVRALGAGFRVLFVQFIKDGSSSEFEILKKLPGFSFKPAGLGRFIKKGGPAQDDLDAAKEGFETARKALASDDFDLIVLDEILCAVAAGLVSEEALLDALQARSPKAEVALTGRGATPKLIEAAGLATEMKCLKHYFKAGRKALKGIEL